jgi:hypothetical protein
MYWGDQTSFWCAQHLTGINKRKRMCKSWQKMLRIQETGWEEIRPNQTPSDMDTCICSLIQLASCQLHVIRAYFNIRCLFSRLITSVLLIERSFKLFQLVWWMRADPLLWLIFLWLLHSQMKPRFHYLLLIRCDWEILCHVCDYHSKNVKAEANLCILCVSVSIFRTHLTQNLW